MTKEFNKQAAGRASLLVFVLACIFYSCVPEIDDQGFYDEDVLSITEYLEMNKDTFSVFYNLVIEAGIYDALNAYNPAGNGFTLFLPTDDAFDAYIKGDKDYATLDELVADNDFVRLLVKYHLVMLGLRTNEFPYGSLPDTTASGDLLTIGFSSNLDSTVYKVNNIAPVIEGNLEMANGYVHVISKVLRPINFSGYDWLFENPEYSILSQALDITGIKESLTAYRTSSSGKLIRNKYTILAENDSIFKRSGIHSIDDLIAEFASPELPYTDAGNDLYQFAAYHILEGEYFLADFDQTRNYNTFANAPVRIVSDLELKINPGTDTLKVIISDQGDTTIVNYISMFYDDSNILTKNGAIHLISDILRFKVPPISSRTFNFYEENLINAVRNTPGTYYFFEEDQVDFEVLSWTGPDQISYIKSSSDISAYGNDYIEIDGKFVINYTVPKILPGRYNFYLRVNSYSGNNENAQIIVYLDGKKMSGIYNLNNGGLPTNPFRVNNDWNGYRIATVEFTKYTEHTITIETLIPGKLIWDNVSFRTL